MDENDVLLNKLRNAKSVNDINMTQKDLIKCFCQKLQELIQLKYNVFSGEFSATKTENTKLISNN